RKADAVTLRRSGFSMLLSDVEAHTRDLEPGSWVGLREEFYGLAHRPLLTPTASFDYYRYLPRIVGIMVACGDWERANRFIDGLEPLFACLWETCRVADAPFVRCLNRVRRNLSLRMDEAILQAV